MVGHLDPKTILGFMSCAILPLADVKCSYITVHNFTKRQKKKMLFFIQQPLSFCLLLTEHVNTRYYNSLPQYIIILYPL